MDNTKITSHAHLKLLIVQLKSERSVQEAELKHKVAEFVVALNPLSILKNSLHDLAGDKEVQQGLVKTGLNLGTNFIIEKILGRNRSVKGFLSSILAEKISATVINNNISKIISGISKLISHRPDKMDHPYKDS